MEEGQPRQEAALRVDGRPASVRLTSDGLTIEFAAGRRRCPWPATPSSSSETSKRLEVVQNSVGHHAWVAYTHMQQDAELHGSQCWGALVGAHAMSTAFPPALCISPLGATYAAVLFSEMLAVQRGQPPPAAAALAPSRLPSCLLSCLSCLRGRAPRVEVLTFRRSPACRCEWAPRTLVLELGSEGAAEDWAAAIGAGIEAAAAGRPK